MDSAAVSSNAQHRNHPRRHDLAHDGALNLADQERIRQEVERAVQQAAEQAVHQPFPVYPTTSIEAGVTTRTGGVPCLVMALPNDHALAKGF